MFDNFPKDIEAAIETDRNLWRKIKELKISRAEIIVSIGVMQAERAAIDAEIARYLDKLSAKEKLDALVSKVNNEIENARGGNE